jgi:hypothetical protein
LVRRERPFYGDGHFKGAYLANKFNESGRDEHHGGGHDQVTVNGFFVRRDVHLTPVTLLSFGRVFDTPGQTMFNSVPHLGTLEFV